ncbi:MAG: tetratricopeptide repeat protein [Cyclobacteriaceae bacterium]
MMVRVIAIIIFLIFSLQGFGQTSEKQLRDSLSFITDDKTKIKLLVKLARKVMVRNSDSAIRIANNAAIIAKRLESDKEIARVYRLTGRIYSDQGKYSHAIENLKLSLAHSEMIHDSSIISSDFNDIGRAYRRIGDSKTALDFLQHGLDIALASHDQEMIGVITNNMALVLNDAGDDTLALEYYQKSLAIAEKLKDTTNIILGLNNLGGQYYRLKNLKKEEEYYLKALELAEKAHNVGSFGVTYDNIGSMWEDRGNLQKAFIYFQKSLEYERKSGVKAYVAEALQSVSAICIKMKNYQMALNYAAEGFKLSEQIQSAEIKAAAARDLAIAYEKTRQFEQSIRFMKIAHTITDSLNSTERARAVSNVASRYELHKKESEIKSLNLEKQMQKNELRQESRIKYGLILFLIIVLILLLISIYQYRARKKANEMLVVWSRAVDQKNQELHNLNKVKDKIFSSIAHDVRSPLASLQSLVSLLDMKALSPDELQRITVELSARVNTTSSLLENLLNWSKNQIATAKANPIKTDLRNLTNECIELYRSNAKEKEIQLINKIEPSSFIYADEEMIRITLRNLISNAIKFTRKGGEVKVESQLQDNILCVSISDSGVGIPQEDLGKIFSLEAYTTPGTAKEKGTGLGLILCKEFIEKNGGEISVDSIHGEGSKFSFTVPAI